MQPVWVIAAAYSCPVPCPCLKYLIVFNRVVAEALTLAEALRDLLGVPIWVNAGEHRQVPVYLGEGVRTVHVGLPNRTTGLRTVTTLMANWAWGKKKEKRQCQSFFFAGILCFRLPSIMNGEFATCSFLSRMWM